MKNSYLRSNLRLIAVGIAVNAAMALLFLLISWWVGGEQFFTETIMGQTMTPTLLVLLGMGTVAAFFLGDKEPKQPGFKEHCPTA